MKDKIQLIISTIIFCIGFLTFGILIELNTNYDIGVGLGFMLGIILMLLIFNLDKIYTSKDNKE